MPDARSMAKGRKRKAARSRGLRSRGTLLVLSAAAACGAARGQALPSVPGNTPPGQAASAPVPAQAPTPGEASGQSAAPASQAGQVAPSPGAQATGGTVHGTVTSGSTPLPGVSVTATNTLTGTKYTTATGTDGSYTLRIPDDGRYVLRTDFAAFAESTRELRFGGATPGPRDVTDRLQLLLLSRVPAQAEDRGALGSSGGAAGGAGRRAGSQYGSGAGGGRGGSQLLGLLGAATAGSLDAGGTTGGSALPSLAGNSDFSSESVAVQGQNNGGNSFAGIDLDALRERAENDPSLTSAFGANFGGPGGGSGRGGGGGGFGGGRGGGGGFGGSFRHFNPNQPHGAFFWAGSNSALNARDYALRGQAIVQPSYATNRFGLTYAGTPNIPHLMEGDKKDFLFFTLSGSRSSQPFDQYGTVPTAAERGGDFSQLLAVNGAQVPIYDPTTGQPFANNIVPATRIQPQASALLGYLPLPNLPGTSRNYQRLTSEGVNNTLIGLRYIHTIGGGSSGSPLAGLVRQYMGTSTGLQQNFHVNFNYSHSASDTLNLFPELGGRTLTNARSVEVGYTLSRGRLTNNLNLDWNRSAGSVTNYFTNVDDVAGAAGINLFAGEAVNPLSYGLPNVTLNQFTGLGEDQPGFTLNQTLALGEASSWTHKKHNLRWGADVKRVHLDLLGSTSVISTGSFIFSGVFTEQPNTSATSGVGNTGQTGVPQSGSSLADLLLGLPQQTQLQAPYGKSYLRENVYDGYFQDDWRVLPSVTLQLGLRYEYFSPYAEKNDRLATLDPGNDFASVATVTPSTTGPYTGAYPRTLINPEKNDFSPRFGVAWRPLKDTVVRGGYGINFANGQYSKFVQQFAFQPPFADVQENEATALGQLTLANGFPAPQTEGNYSVDKNYRLPYIQLWNVNVQRTLPQGIVLNIGYSGSKGTRLDIVDAPGRTATASLSGVLYDYEQATAFSNFESLVVSARKRLQKGLSLQATYTYAHSIDDATSVGGVGNAVAQNWQDLLAEESNSSFDIRHKVNGSFLYELPFGADKTYFTTGRTAHALEGLSVSGTYSIATGEPLTPSYEASVSDIARGSTGSERPDRVPGVSLSTGARNVNSWFNPGAFTQPTGVYGTASRYSIAGPGTITVDGSLAKTISFGETRSFEDTSYSQQRLQHCAVLVRGHAAWLGLVRSGDRDSRPASVQFHREVSVLA